MIDNYDSFTFNLVHYFRGIGQRVEVYRNDEITVADIIEKDPQYLVISPGPCSPNEAGISLQAIAMFAGKIPMLGVCLGHQCIAQHFGANIIKAKQPMHGKLSQVTHNNSGLFNALLQPLTVTRYHSLVVEPSSLPEDLIVTAKACYELTSGESTIANIEDKEPNENNIVQNQVVDNIDINYEHDEIMGLQHRSLPIHSVQFHPESILTEQGHQLLANFIDMYAK